MYRKIVSLVFMVALMLQLAPASLALGKDSRENVIVLMLDDMNNAHFQALLDGGFIPNIEKYILGHGVNFTNSFVTNALCCPSRATLLTGQYTKNHGILVGSQGISQWLKDQKPFAEPDQEYNTLTTWLHGVGYKTALIGKYLNRYGIFTKQTYVPPGYDFWRALVEPSNYKVYDYKVNENGKLRDFGFKNSDYQTDVLADYAKQFIRMHTGTFDKDPFFMIVTPIAPHVEVPLSAFLKETEDYTDHFAETIRPARRHAHLVDGDLSNGEMPDLVHTPAFNEFDLSDKPAFVQALPLLDNLDFDNVNKQFKDQLASIIAVDDMVGEMVSLLKNRGEFENTTIIFTSDNGYLHGQHRLSSKLFAYEESIRVPLIISRLGRMDVGDCPAIALNNDLAATIADIADVEPGRDVDGRSLMSLIKDTNSKGDRRQFMIEHYNELDLDEVSLGDLSPPLYKAVRFLNDTKDELYVEWYEESENDSALLPGEITFKEYYNLKTDPDQMNSNPSVLSSSSHTALEYFLDEFKDCVGASCRYLEDLSFSY